MPRKQDDPLLSTEHLTDMARIWFSHAFGHRDRKQKHKCETLGWYYLMQSIMTELHA